MKITQNSMRVAAVALALGLGALSATAPAQDHGHGGSGMMGGGMMAGRGGAMTARGPDMIERQPEPHGYTRFEAPPQTRSRPNAPDAALFHHNFDASRAYHIGPYHAPHGFHYRRIRYGEILPSLYWGPQYLLSDYWLFGLDIPPLGYEWVRYGTDALLVDTTTGEVASAVYDNFR